MIIAQQDITNEASTGNKSNASPVSTQPVSAQAEAKPLARAQAQPLVAAQPSKDFVDLADAIFALGVLSMDMDRCNKTLLCRAGAIMAKAIPAASVGIAAYKGNLAGQCAASCIAVAGAGLKNAANAITDADGEAGCVVENCEGAWLTDVIAKQIEIASSGKLVDAHEKKLADTVWPAVTTAAQAAGKPSSTLMGVFAGDEDIQLLIVISGIEDKVALSRAHALIGYLVNALRASWHHEPQWMTDLKPASRTVLELALMGLDDDQIADYSGLTYHSVRAHLKRLFRAAGVRSRLHLMQSCKVVTASPEAIRMAVAS